jgi:hypothetical protein
VTAKFKMRLRRVHRDTGKLKVGKDCGLFFLSAPEQAQHPSFMLLHDCPAKTEPKPAVARVAEQAGSHVRPRTPIRSLNMAVID